MNGQGESFIVKCYHRDSNQVLDLSGTRGAINGCEICVRSHETVVRETGLSDDQVNDAVRIAATIHAAAVALETTGISTAA